LKLLALLLALAAQPLVPPGSLFQRRDWLLGLEAWLAARLADPWLRLMVFLALLAIAAAWILQELRDWAFGAPALLAGTFVLLWSFGDEDYHAAIERLARRETGAEPEERRPGAGPWTPPDSGMETAGTNADRCALLYCGFGRWFAPLFYFALAGPLGAGIYRVVAVLARARRGEEYLRVLAWLDWVPARLLGLSFALTGDFAAVAQRLREYGLLDGLAAPVFLERQADAALGVDGGVPAAASLLRRSAALWLALLIVILLAV
jgi:AmpE protein